MTQHQYALQWARDHVGKREDPLGSNNGAFVRSCQEATWLPVPKPGQKGWPWCVAAWVKAWSVAGRKLPYLGAGAYEMLKWYDKHLPAWTVPLSQAKPGAAVILSIGSGHCAMLAKPYVSGRDVHTIDGNWGDKMAPAIHPSQLVRGVIDPPEDVGVVKSAKPPVYEVVTSASGHSQVVYVSGAKAVSKKLDALLRRYGKVTIRRRRKK